MLWIAQSPNFHVFSPANSQYVREKKSIDCDNWGLDQLCLNGQTKIVKETKVQNC